MEEAHNHRIAQLLTPSTTTTPITLSTVKLLHSKAISLSLQNNINLCKSLIKFYLFFHLLDSALLVLKSIQTPSDISLWNTLIAAFSKNHKHKEALWVYNTCHLYPFVKPDAFTYPSALKSCIGLSDSITGCVIHTRLLKSGYNADIVVSSSLVGMYAKCGYFNFAIKVFDEMSERDVACWNTVISCYYQDGQASKALEVFDRMTGCGFEPDSVTLSTVFSACARVLDLERGARVYEEFLRRGREMDGFVSAAVVDMYGKCGCLGRAREVFDRISVKTVVAWNSMINGYSLKGDSNSCYRLFFAMNEEGIRPTSTTISSLLMVCSRISDICYGKFVHGYLLRNRIDIDIFVTTSLIDLYFKCGNIEYTDFIFRRSPKNNVVVWNVMISGHVASGHYSKAIDVFHTMKLYDDVKPDAITFTSTLSACTQLTALQQGREIHDQIRSHNFDSNEIVTCTLVELYAKCGALDDARKVFDSMPMRDAVSWTSMIAAYGSNGQALEALDLFEEMRRTTNVRPDRVTFLALISACCHGGLADAGVAYFHEMASSYEIEPGLEHYSCLVDLLGRLGRLREAHRVLQRFPGLKMDAGAVGSFLSACGLHGNLELGEEASRLLLEKDPDDQSAYIGLSNMYASAGRWDGVRKVREMMRKRGLRKNPGCSWTEIDKNVHQFFAEDFSHAHIQWICECLEGLLIHMEEDTLEEVEMGAEMIY